MRAKVETNNQQGPPLSAGLGGQDCRCKVLRAAASPARPLGTVWEESPNLLRSPFKPAGTKAVHFSNCSLAVHLTDGWRGDWKEESFRPCNGLVFLPSWEYSAAQ